MDKVRVEMHLKLVEVKALDKITESEGRSRKISVKPLSGKFCKLMLAKLKSKNRKWKY